MAYYEPIARAVRTGNVRLLNDALEEYQADFIRSGTYLLLEKLKLGVYRTLFMRVHLLWKRRHPGDMDKPFKLQLQLFQAALGASGVEMDLDEVECIVANLIYRKYIKGYISHKARARAREGQRDGARGCVLGAGGAPRAGGDFLTVAGRLCFSLPAKRRTG